jgi:uncharacterized membrane protein
MTVLRWIHIIAGGLALILGPVAMLAAKGGRTHILAGRAYLWLMGIVGLSGLVLAIAIESRFLGGLAVLAFHLAFTGARGFRRASAARGIPEGISTLLLLAGALAIGATAIGRREGSWVVNPLGAVFAAGALSLAILDSIRWLRPCAAADRGITTHLVRMLASYIAVVTAFSVTALSGVLPWWAGWFGPGVVGGVGITLWARRVVSQPPALRTRP